MIKAQDVKVGRRGANITVRATKAPDEHGYQISEEFEITIDQAKELYKLLDYLIDYEPNKVLDNPTIP